MTSQTFRAFLLFFVSIPLFATNTFERDIRAIDTLTVGAFNVENLFEDALDEPDRNPLQILPTQRFVNPRKTVEAIKGVAKAIQEAGYDILVVEEVENLATIQKLSKYYLRDEYSAYLIEGNDPRGIDVGFLVKRDLPFSYKERTNKTEMWNDPINGNKKHKLFSRDLPEFYVSAKNSSDPLFVLLGTHYKSKIDRPNDKQSKVLRKAQVERTVEIIERIQREQGSSVRMMLTGDFNGVVTEEPEFESIQQTNIMEDAFDVVVPHLTKTQRITHCYFPKGHPVEKTQLDALLVNRNMETAVEEAFVYRYKDAHGKTLPIPNTEAEKKKNPSDHFPVVVHLRMSDLVH